jgi:hypothetical protein
MLSLARLLLKHKLWRDQAKAQLRAIGENQARLKLRSGYSQNAGLLNRPSLEGRRLSGHWRWAVDPM